MAVLNFNANAVFGENGTGKFYIATNWAGTTFDSPDGTNETAALATLDALTWADVGYFENFAPKLTAGEERIITTDYCGVGEISRKAEQVWGFGIDIQEIAEMSNLATMLGYSLNTATAGEEVLGAKRQLQTIPYVTFKFESCPRDGIRHVLYFVKAVRTGDLDIPFTNLKKEDFAGITFEYETADGGNFYWKKII